jgi:outer membrane biosynthesis protein TonB
MNAQELAKESLIKLRKMANELGIQNYAKYSKEELAKLIEQKQNGVETYIDPEMIASDEDVAKEEEMVKEHAETVKENAEEPRPEDEKARKAVKKEKTPKEPKPKKEKKAKVVVSRSPKEASKPEKLHETTSKIYDELLKNDGRSFGQIAKDLGTHYNMVRRTSETYFVTIPQDQAETSSTNESAAEEASAE